MNYYEFTRRVPVDKLHNIEKKLSTISNNGLDCFIEKLSNEQNIFYNEELIYQDNFPFLLLKSFLTNKLSLNYISSMLVLWACTREFLTKESLDKYNPKFIKLFSPDLTAIGTSKEFLSDCFYSYLLNLFLKKPSDIVEAIFQEAKKIPVNEQGFWIIDNFNRCSNSIAKAIEKKGFIFFNKGTVSPLLGKLEIIPNFSIIQIALNAAFVEPVTLNPVLGISSVLDIHTGSDLRKRDIAIPFFELYLPENADGFRTETTLEFVAHDIYHSIRASRVNSVETKEYLFLGERLEQIQGIINECLNKFKIRHDLHCNELKKYFQKINKITEIRSYYIQKIIKNTLNEDKLIKTLSSFSRLLGKLKFELYDMEMPHSGGRFDPYKDYNDSYILFIRIVFNLQFLIKKLISKYNEFTPAHNKILNIILLNVLCFSENIKVIKKYKEEIAKLSSNNSIILLDNSFNCENSLFNTIIIKDIKDFSANDFIELLKKAPEEYRLKLALRKSFFDNKEFLFTPQGLQIFDKVLELLNTEDRIILHNKKITS